MEYLRLHSTVLQHRHQNSAKCLEESLLKSSSLIIGPSSSLVSKISFFLTLDQLLVALIYLFLMVR